MYKLKLILFDEDKDKDGKLEELILESATIVLDGETSKRTAKATFFEAKTAIEQMK